MTQRYAVIADRDCLVALSGTDSVPYAGVCLVDGDEAACHMVDGPAQIDALVEGIPCCPSRPGNPVALPGLEAELEALRFLADEAIRAGAPPALPAGFVPARPRMMGGLRARLSEFGLEIAVSLELARSLGWTAGDGITLGVGQPGLFAVARGGSGAFLEESLETPGELRLDRDLSGLPLDVQPGPAGWVSPEYCVSEGSLILSWRSLEAGRAAEASSGMIFPEAESGSPPKARTGVFRRLGRMLWLGGGSRRVHREGRAGPAL